MNINLSKLNYSFLKKPLLIGGKAMEYYGIRKAGEDIDFIADEKDIVALIKQYPDRIKNLSGDLSVCPFEFEFWRTVCFYDYNYLKEGAIEKEDYLIISLEKLLFTKALAMKEPKYLEDTKLIVADIIKIQEKRYTEIESRNKELLQKITGITYIEKTEPVK